MDPKLTHMFHVQCSSSFVVRPSRVSGTFRFSSQVSIYDSFYDSLASKGAALLPFWMRKLLSLAWQKDRPLTWTMTAKATTTTTTVPRTLIKIKCSWAAGWRFTNHFETQQHPIIRLMLRHYFRSVGRGGSKKRADGKLRAWWSFQQLTQEHLTEFVADGPGDDDDGGDDGDGQRRHNLLEKWGIWQCIPVASFLKFQL